MKCPPKYKNLNEIQSFSEQKYATVEWAEQNCENDEYLKQEVEELNYRSPARIRKRWKPIVIDELNSYGYLKNPDGEVTFSDMSEFDFTIDFSTLDRIDTDRSDCEFTTYLDNESVEHKCATVPKINDYTDNTSCKNTLSTGQVGAYWYVGFDKNKHYHVRPDWLKDWRDDAIPAVSRAQTITIPDGIENGVLDSVDLMLESTGGIHTDWGSPLYVQIWKTRKFHATKTYWDKKRKRSRMRQPVQWEYIYYPADSTPYSALATAEYNPKITAPAFQNFKFDKKVIVNGGEHYAIVILSPLSHYSHCPRIGGWSRDNLVDKYSGGDAFLSERNGRDWKRYGKNEDTIKDSQYKFGKYAPVDFAFKCHILEYTQGYDMDEDFFLYLKPIHLNPIKSVQLVPNGFGNEPNQTEIKLEFQVSPTGKANSWVTLPREDLSIQFNRDEITGEYPRFAYIRVKMSTTSTEYAPYLTSLKVIVNMDLPKEMYVRTAKYNPKFTPMLGASAWSKIFSNFETDPGVNGSAEIITEKVSSEHFDIITAKELEEYTSIEGLDIEKITDEDLEVRYTYLRTSPVALDILKQNKIYVKPHTYLDGNNEEVTHPMSFENGVQFENSPAYPMIGGAIKPRGNEPDVPLAEWIDYRFDYDNDILIFNEVLNQYYDEQENLVEEGIEDYIPVGTLEVSYQSIFVQDLTSKELGVREDGEGFILDYFKEEFIINESDVENRYLQLKFNPCDPLREVVIADEEYLEGVHFQVDYLNNRISFPVVDVNENSTLLTDNLGKEAKVVYTPNLDDTGLVIGYRALRENNDKQMKIKDNYIEYKV